jgi:hypothetical protein
MSSDDLNKSLAESTRALAKAFIVWGLESMDRVQEFSHQAQEYMQELVTEAKKEQTAGKTNKSSDEEPHYKQAEVPAEAGSREPGAGSRQQ